MKKVRWLVSVLLLLGVLLLVGGERQRARATYGQSAPVVREWEIDGVKRMAAIVAPKAEGVREPAPVVFVFHGHGGNMRNSARVFRIHQLWPEALVVYMQGLPTPGITDPEGKKSGWQKEKGDQNDRDLKFFDVVLATMQKEYSTDPKRVFITGHSNGAGFTYLLWAERTEKCTAFAPSAGGGRMVFSLKPKPALQIAGERDPLVRVEGQRRIADFVRKLNDCEPTGKEWGKYTTWYASSKNAPFAFCLHPGDHKFPDFAPELIVRFFQTWDTAKP